MVHVGGGDLDTSSVGLDLDLPRLSLLPVLELGHKDVEDAVVDASTDVRERGVLRKLKGPGEGSASPVCEISESQRVLERKE